MGVSSASSKSALQLATLRSEASGIAQPLAYQCWSGELVCINRSVSTLFLSLTLLISLHKYCKHFNIFFIIHIAIESEL